jgi:hypothetical protein
MQRTGDAGAWEPGGERPERGSGCLAVGDLGLEQVLALVVGQPDGCPSSQRNHSRASLQATTMLRRRRRASESPTKR